MNIKIEKLTDEQRGAFGIPSAPANVNGWNIWECEPSKFNWHYESTEKAYVYEGRVKVTTNEGLVDIRAGDFVTFPSGLSCTWQVIDKVVKVYRFE